jgi:lysophospholipase L1-like esterase
VSYATAVAALTNVKALWLLDETSGSPADSVGAHTGTISGSVTQGVTSVVGTVSHSASFAGGRVDFGTSADFNPGTGDFSVGAWFKGTTTGTQVIYGDTSLRIALAITSNHLSLFFAGNLYHGTTNVCDGTAHFALVTRVGTALKVYLDGNSVEMTQTDAADTTVSTAVSVGDYQSGGSPYTGVVGGVFVQKGTGCSGSDATALYNAGTGGGAFTAGTATVAYADASNVHLSCTASSNGTPTVTRVWKKCSTATGTFTSTGVTTLTLTDAGPNDFYYCEFTDGAAAVVTSNIVHAKLWSAPIVLGAVGDSILFGFNLSAGQDPVTQAANALAGMTNLRRVTVSNQAISATKTADWLPTDPSNNLTTAETALTAAGATDVLLMLGANDARTTVAAATYGSNLSTIVTHLLANVTGLQRVWLCYPIWSGDTIATSLAEAQLLVDYQARIDALVNGTTIRAGDKLGYEFFAAHPEYFQVDNLHPNAAGAAVYGAMLANAIDNGLNVSAGGGGSGGVAILIL